MRIKSARHCLLERGTLSETMTIALRVESTGHGKIYMVTPTQRDFTIDASSDAVSKKKAHSKWDKTRINEWDYLAAILPSVSEY